MQGTAPAHVTPQDNTPVPNDTPPSTALFKKLIAQRYTVLQTADVTKSVDFLAYSEGAPMQHEAVYARGLPQPYGRGHVVTAYPVHAKLAVRTRERNPNVPDSVMEIEADYLCYRFADSGAWTASQEREFSRRIYYQNK